MTHDNHCPVANDREDLGCRCSASRPTISLAPGFDYEILEVIASPRPPTPEEVGSACADYLLASIENSSTYAEGGTSPIKFILEISDHLRSGSWRRYLEPRKGLSIPPPSEEEVADLIQEATDTERERCAQLCDIVVDSNRREAGNMLATTWFREACLSVADAASFIAAKIRGTSQPPITIKPPRPEAGCLRCGKSTTSEYCSSNCVWLSSRDL